MTPTDKATRQLATRVVKEARYNLRVKFGRTNGRTVLHLIRPRPDAGTGEAASLTMVATVAEWMAHPWNRLNRGPKKVKPAPETDFATEAVNELSQSFGKLVEAAKPTVESLQRFVATHEEVATP